MAFDATLLRSSLRKNTFCVAFRNSVQSIDNDTETLIQDYTTFVDPLGVFNTGTHKIDVPETGIWLVSGEGQWAANATGYRQMLLRADNGSGTHAQSCPSIGAGAVMIQSVSYLFRVAAIPETFYLRVRHTAGAALNCDQGHLFAVKVSDL